MAKPRTHKPGWGPAHPFTGSENTWIENEVFCYPKGGFTRRACAINTTTRKRNIKWCGIPDTYFTIPCSKGGYIYIEENVVFYSPKKTQMESEKERRKI